MAKRTVSERIAETEAWYRGAPERNRPGAPMIKILVGVTPAHSEHCDVPESAALSASPIACAVADAWAAGRMACRCADVLDNHQELARALDALEAATRESPLRKVKP